MALVIAYREKVIPCDGYRIGLCKALRRTLKYVLADVMRRELRIAFKALELLCHIKLHFAYEQLSVEADGNLSKSHNSNL